MTNQLNLSPISATVKTSHDIKIDGKFNHINQYTQTSINQSAIIGNLSHVGIDFNKPLYQRAWTITQLNKILLAWYEMDMNVNDLLPDNLRLLQAFYQSFSKLSDNEQEQLIEVYHPYNKQINISSLITIKHKLLKHHAELIINNG